MITKVKVPATIMNCNQLIPMLNMTISVSQIELLKDYTLEVATDISTHYLRTLNSTQV